MAYYVMMDTSSEKTGNSRKLGELLTLENNRGESVLPVFSDYLSLLSFAKAYYAREDNVEVTPLWMYPFQVSQMVSPMEEAGQLEYLIFNPTPPSSDGGISRTKATMPVRRFCQTTEKVRGRQEELVAQGNIDLSWDNVEVSAEEIARDLRAKDIADDATARGAQEWEVEEAPKRNWARKIGRNKPCPCGSGKKYKKCHGNPLNPPSY